MSRISPREDPRPPVRRKRGSGIPRAWSNAPRGVRWAVAAVAAIAVLAVALSFIDEPMRRAMEKRMNASLKGYSVVLPALHFNPIGLSVTLRGLTVRQNAHPEPPVARFPKLHASVEWKELLTLHLVADFLLEQPRVHVNLPQLQQEARNPTPVKEEGWQQAVEAIYPLKINLLRVEDADVVYIDEDPRLPLHIAHLTIRAHNIRNIHSRDRVYPSPFHAEGVVFDRGRGVLDGHADFLAEPFPGIHTLYRLTDVPLDRLRPIVERSNITIRGGVLSTDGEIEYSPKIELVDVRNLAVRGVAVDFIHTLATAGNEREKKEAVKKAASDVTNKEGTLLRVRRLRIENSELGLVNKAHNPSYRTYLSHASIEVANLSNHFREGPARATLTGRFMGSGAAKAFASFRPEDAGPDLDLDASIEHTDLTRMNDILRAYGKFDVAEGDFSFYTQLRVRRGELRGYMKPMFANLKVYSAAQDKGKSFGKKVYERVVAGLATLLKSHREKAVATQVNLSGRLENPRESMGQIIAKMIENAFIRAILPGFDREVSFQTKK